MSRETSRVDRLIGYILALAWHKFKNQGPKKKDVTSIRKMVIKAFPRLLVYNKGKEDP